jgi:hypothetical protein
MIRFATSDQHPNLTADEQLGVAALARLGIEVQPLIWDRSPIVAEPVILRSCWDYHEKSEAFRDWVSQLPRCFNPAKVVLWNMDKRYLQELQQPMPPTLWLERGQAVPSLPFSEAVVKPVIGMTSHDTFRLPGREAELAELVSRRAVMIQEFVPAILTEGEISLVFFGGQFSHAIRKRAAGGEFACRRSGAAPASPSSRVPPGSPRLPPRWRASRRWSSPASTAFHRGTSCC